MREWTEQEEQEMIERAKAGEPEANYELSLWALARSEEEPDEPRWNRLAAKCLVKAAQAGYGPAQRQMAGLLDGAAEPSQPAEPPRRVTRPAARSQEPVSIHDARRAAGDTSVPRQTTTARRPVSRQPEEPDEGSYEEYDDAPRPRRAPAARRAAPDDRPAPRRRAPEPVSDHDDEDYGDEDYDGYDPDPDDWDDGSARGKGRKNKARSKCEKGEKREKAKKGSPFSNWGDTQWRRVELVCVAICVLLLAAIAVMVFTGRHAGGGDETQSAIPPAGEAVPAAATDTPAPVETYPDEATRAAIEAAELDIPPMEEDFREGPTTATVSVNSISLRLRKGPNTSYTEITSMPDGSKVEVFADKNDWSLVRYQAEDGPIFGWCSSTYLIIDATPASIG